MMGVGSSVGATRQCKVSQDTILGQSNIPCLICVLPSAVVQVADETKDHWENPDRTALYHYDFGDGCMKELPECPTKWGENRALGTFRGMDVAILYHLDMINLGLLSFLQSEIGVSPWINPVIWVAIQ